MEINQGKLPVENKELEQYFFTEKVLDQITNTFQYEDNVLCLCTPSVADAFWKKNKEVICIDVDNRFNYLPKFINCDITKEEIKLPDDFVPNLIIVDPPFFKMKLIDLYNCIEKITKKK